MGPLSPGLEGGAPAPWRGLALGLLALALWEALGLDLEVARAIGAADGFAWREEPLFKHVLHDGGRWLAWLGAALWAACLLRPWAADGPPARMALGSVSWQPAGPSRKEGAYWLTVALACALTISLLKRLSSTSCPWDLAEFGGVAMYVPHWRLAVRDGGPGRCFPSGHAVSAFCFFALAFLWRPHRPALARRIFAAVVLAGVLYGAVQVLRGAHYPSHVAWTAWLCLAGCTLAARWAPAARHPPRRLVQRRPERPNSAA